MSTNVGLNWIGVLTLVLGLLQEVPEGHIKSILLGIALVSIAIVAFATRGSGMDRRQSEELLDVSGRLEDVLRAGRVAHEADKPSGD